jgi:hypothetical protein
VRLTRLTIQAAFALALGCAGPQIEVRPVVPPLPTDRPATLGDLLPRARAQASAATEAFYVDDWSRLEEAARGIEATAAELPKADGLMPNRKPAVDAAAVELAASAQSLRTAARGKDVDQTTRILQRIHLAIRELQRKP